ncbi:unnamed protein product, partial [marine sediment metagenome]
MGNGYHAAQSDTDRIIEELRKGLDPNYFTYYFNHSAAAVDADYFTEGGDAGGGFDVVTVDNDPASRKLYTQNVLNNDYYIHADAKYAKLWNFQSGTYQRITLKTRLKMNTTADTQALWGLFEAGAFPTTYAEPVVDCAHFFLDDGVDAANFVCRTYDAAAEEQTSGSAFDTTDYHDFELVWAETSVIFMIDDAVVATHATTIPDSPLGVVYLIRTQAVAVKSL